MTTAPIDLATVRDRWRASYAAAASYAYATATAEERATQVAALVRIIEENSHE